VNGLTLVALIAIAVGAFVAYRLGVRRGRLETPPAAWRQAAAPPPAVSPGTPAAARPAGAEPAVAEASAAEAGSLRAELAALREALSAAHAEAARYRQIVVDIEDRAPPPLLDSPHAPDDLKLIVGVGPVLERMLQQMGIGTYRQIARWTERDIDEFDARLPEFHGRIRRDDWVTQARELHQSKYGERP
jgi:NADH-quinone oxidoreductase subunit E